MRGVKENKKQNRKSDFRDVESASNKKKEKKKKAICWLLSPEHNASKAAFKCKSQPHLTESGCAAHCYLMSYKLWGGGGMKSEKLRRHQTVDHSAATTDYLPAPESPKLPQTMGDNVTQPLE